MLMTTTPEVAGRAIAEYIDVITAQGVLGVNAFKDVAAGMRNIFGGRSKSYENELTAGVNSVLDELGKHAAEVGADAVVGVDIDYEIVGSNMLMISASGTAVKLSLKISGVKHGSRSGRVSPALEGKASEQSATRRGTSVPP